jgi:hypothetical protein
VLGHAAMKSARVVRRFWATLLLIIFPSGCGARGTTDSGAPEPVPECLQYESALGTCFHRDVGFALQPGLLAQTDADRRRIGAMCTQNLKRLRAACR